tara:strand:- start:922 stop:1173 length:252 start_codon:yes stop_codon:yes gene_type:complete
VKYSTKRLQLFAERNNGLKKIYLEADNAPRVLSATVEIAQKIFRELKNLKRNTVKVENLERVAPPVLTVIGISTAVKTKNIHF